MRSGTVENLHDFKGKLDKIKELKIFKKIYAVTLDKCEKSLLLNLSLTRGTLYSWQKISGKWSYLGGTDDGIMRIGWQKIGTNWYYFNSSGYMLTGWQKIGTKWYYFGESDDGAMRIGWQKIGGDRYYFGEANDGAMKTGW